MDRLVTVLARDMRGVQGTVLAVESGGIVLVRFENDGSERRLMASVAPLRRLRG